MKFSMFFIVSHKDKITNSIVLSIPIYVVNNFFINYCKGKKYATTISDTAELFWGRI